MQPEAESKAETKIGCCGFAVSQAEYFHLFRLIEIQQTFYQIPQLKTAEKWQKSAPPDFEFTMKAWQLITHEPASPTYRRLRDNRLRKKIWPAEKSEVAEKSGHAESSHYGSFRFTAEVVEAWNRTAQFARTLGARVIVFQCPASFQPDRENIDHMRKFFTRIDRGGFWLAWEPRGSWPQELTVQLCRDLELIHCVDPFKNEPQFGDFQYFRLHGISGYSYRYTDADLRKLKTWAERKPTCVLFNNQWMKEDALRFMELVK